MSLTVLVDGKNSLYRHNYTSNLISPEGEKVSGVHGMFGEVVKLIQIQKPDEVVIAWDKGKSKGRLELYPEYKGHRKIDQKVLDNLAFQVAHAKAIFKNLPVRQIALEGVEADDIIGRLSKKIKGKKIIFSNDTDFLQLVSKDVSQWFPTKKKLVTVNNIEDYLGFDHKRYILWKAITGDSSDNIKGQYKIGEMKATKFVRGEIKLKLDKPLLERDMKLITIGSVLTEEEKEFISSKLVKERKKAVNPVMVRHLFKKLGFRNLLFNFESNMYVLKSLDRRIEL